MKFATIQSKKIIGDPHALAAMRDRVKTEMQSRISGGKFEVRLCMGGGCIASGSHRIKEALLARIRDKKLEGKVTLTETGCLGPCVCGPVLLVRPGDVFYQNIGPKDAEEIIDLHIEKGEVVKRLLPKGDLESESLAKLSDIPFFKRQKKLVLRNCGQVDPLRIEDYIGMDGFAALAKAHPRQVFFKAGFDEAFAQLAVERAKLVFLIEARPAAGDAVKLHPGQPVEVRFQ